MQPSPVSLNHIEFSVDYLLVETKDYVLRVGGACNFVLQR